MSTTLDQVLALAGKRFTKERSALLPDGDVFESLGVDSMQMLELLSELEAHFDVEIPDYELRDVRTFAQLASCIDRRR